MLQVAARSEDTGISDGEALAVGPVAKSLVPAFQPAPVGGRYGERRALNLPAIAVIILIHAVAITAIMQVRQHIIERREARLSVVNLTPPPPPPAEEPPPPSQPQIVAPPPLVRVPQPPVQQIVTTPVPTVPAPVIAAPSPIAASAPAVSAPPSTVQSSDLSTRMLSGKPPRYPIESRRKHEQGTVVLSLTLGLDGKVSAIAIARSSGFSRLDDAARDAVRSWRWAPTIRDGQPVMVRGLVEIPFLLQG